MHEALYCSMLYRRKKVKSFQEGFAERRDLKLVLLDENRKVIESIFSKELLCDGLEIDFDQNYCLVGDLAREGGSASSSRPAPPVPVQAKRRIGLKRSTASICGSLKVVAPSEATASSSSAHVQLQQQPAKKSRISIQDVLLFKKQQSQEYIGGAVYSNDIPAIRSDSSSSSHSRTSEQVAPSNSVIKGTAASDNPSLVDAPSAAAIGPPFASAGGRSSHYQAHVPAFKPKTDEELLSFFLGEEEDDYEQVVAVEKGDQTNQVENEEAVDPQDETIMMEPLNPPKPPSTTFSIPRKPLLSKFTIPSNTSNEFKPASLYQSQSGQSKPPAVAQHLRPQTTDLYQSLRPNIYHLVFQPAAPVFSSSQRQQKKGGKTKQQYQQSFRLFREMTIPDKFKDMAEYSKTLFSSITELMNLELADLRGRFDKVPQKTEDNMRAVRISFYSHVSLKSAYSAATGAASSSDLPNMLLSFPNKEHHSLYSKDDIWIVSKDPSMKNGEFFRSFYYGTSSGGDCVEVCPLTTVPNSCGAWMNNPSISLYAVRAFNANSECMMLDMLGSELFRETPLVKRILHKCITAATPPSESTELLVLEECVDDFEELFEDAIEEHGLNEDQAKVIRRFSQSLSGRNSCPVVLAHGVYGAGKSFLIAVLILTLEKANRLGLFAPDTMQVVFSSMTNVAVDRILLSLLEMDFNDFARVGSIKKIAKPVLNYTCSKSKNNDLKELNEMLAETEDEGERQEIQNAIKRFQQSTATSLLDDTFLIGVTCSATNFEVLGDVKCAIVILDECSQMTEPMSLLPIVRFRAKYALLVGDPKQLAPTLSHNLDAALVKSKNFGIERTMFERLSDAGIAAPILLSRQYRCHPQISRLSNELFYDSRLRDGAGVGQKRSSLLPSLGPLAFVRVEGGQETKSGNGSFKNDAEIALITKIVAGLMMDNQVTAEQIGVISLYKGQSELISSTLKSSGITGVQAATVDSFQGSEKEVIIVSTVRSTSSSFLEDPRRVNVALTRAKRHLIILACDGMANGSKLWRQIQVLSSDANPGVIPSRAFLALLNSSTL